MDFIGIIKRANFLELALFDLALEWIFEREARISFANTHELVVLANALAATEGTGLDLASAEADGKMGNASVFGFAGTVAHNATVAMFFSKLDGVNGFSE